MWTNANGLILLMVLFSLSTPLQVAGDTILWKTMDKADTLLTSNAPVIVFLHRHGDCNFRIPDQVDRKHVVAFWFGFSLSSIALVCVFIYRRIMRSGGALEVSSSTQPGAATLFGNSLCAGSASLHSGRQSIAAKFKSKFFMPRESFAALERNSRRT